MPGGFGTLDELFEVAALKTKGYIRKDPIILGDKDFYSALFRFLKESQRRGFIPKPLEEILILANSQKDILRYFSKSPQPLNPRRDDIDIGRAISEIFRILRKIDTIGATVGIFGSHTIKENEHYFKLAKELSQNLFKHGISVIYPGFNGISAAVWQGHQPKNHSKPKDLKAVSVVITREYRQPKPPADMYFKFSYLFEQKLVFINTSKLGFIFFPGGIATLDVLFEVLCLMQTKKIAPAPVVLVGKEFWQPLDDWIKNVLLPQGVISPQDLQLYVIRDDSRQIVDFILGNKINSFGNSSSPLKQLRLPLSSLSQKIKSRLVKSFIMGCLGVSSLVVLAHSSLYGQFKQTNPLF